MINAIFLECKVCDIGQFILACEACGVSQAKQAWRIGDVVVSSALHERGKCVLDGGRNICQIFSGEIKQQDVRLSLGGNPENVMLIPSPHKDNVDFTLDR